MRQVRAGSLFVLMLAIAAVGCSDNTPCADSISRCTRASAQSFESDLPADTGGASGQADAVDFGKVAASTSASTSAAADADAAREIAEADIIQLQGKRLYALSRAAGLVVIDVSDPSALKLLGRYRELPTTPFEMYLRDGVALVMFTGWGQYAPLADGSYGWATTSKVLALDVQDPANIQQLGSFDVPGNISDSRMVGDVLYVVGHENGFCWRCKQDQPRTSIVSLLVADPRNVSKVDELFYDDASGSWGQRSVTVTPQRMYVAGPASGQDMAAGSTIQVIDISAKDGKLVEGASVEVDGQVNSRWQMDEYDGVLRVVSQPPQSVTASGRVTKRPAIQTFRVESAQKLSALGSTTIDLPPNDTLRSVRFDGERAYAITAERKDPLFTLDLSDPKKPRVAGMLELPGYVYHMEPRGNRLLGLGFDQGNAAGAITVSLFDVTDMTKPSELSRVNFGGDWGSLPADQDRIHKVFRVLDDKGLILVPFSGWKSNPRVEGGCYVDTRLGGVQIVDFAQDKLAARGAAQSGESRRAMLIDTDLVSVSDQQVQAFDISDRDAPQQISQVVVSRNLSRAVELDNGVVARFSSESDGDVQIDFAYNPDAEDPSRSEAALSLAELTGQSTDRCEGSLSMEQTFVRGSTLELLYFALHRDRSSDTNMNTRGLLVLDVSDASNPKRVANVTWDLDEWAPYSSWSRYGYFGQSQTSVRTTDALATLESKWEKTGDNNVQRVRLRVLDLRDLGAVHNQVLPFETLAANSGLLVDGDVVMTSHVASSSHNVGRGSYFVDRFDISNPEEPRQLPEINVPGALLLFDSASRRALTSEQVRVEVDGKVTSDECYKRFADAEWRSVEPRGATARPSIGGSNAATAAPPAPLGTCTGYKQRLNMVQLAAVSARLDDRIELPEAKQLFSLSRAGGAVFASLAHDGISRAITSDISCFGACGRARPEPGELLTLGGFAKGSFEQGHLTVEETDASGWYDLWGAPPVYAYGERALLFGRSDAAIVDASDVTAPVLVRRLPVLNALSHVEVQDDTALLTLGQRGVQWLDLKD